MLSLELNKAIIKVKDELNVVIAGLSRKDYDYFYNLFGIYAKDYRFKHLYTIGKWDGKVRFFDKNGNTSINLLPLILPELEKRGYKLSLVDNRSPVNLHIPEIDNTFLSDVIMDDEPIILGDHQVEGINRITENAGGILLAATGAGKSYICASLIKLYNMYCNFRCLVIVPNKDLINQTSKDINNMGIPAGRFFGDVKEPNVTNVVSTWQSLNNSPALMAQFDVIIVDECHGTKSNVLKQMILDYGKDAKVRIGLTGTLPKDPSDAMSVKYVLGEVQYVVPAIDLINKGWLAKPNIFIKTLIEDLKAEWNYFKKIKPEEASKTTYKKFKNNFYPEYSAEKSYLQSNKARREWIANLVKRKVEEKGNAFVLVNNIPFGRKLAEEIGNAYFIYGKDETAIRQQIYELFANNDNIIVVTTFQLASTGLNIKRIFNLFMIDAGKSFIQIIQTIGRGLRKAKDKNSVDIYDINTDLKFGAKHMKDRKKYYEEVNYEFTHENINYNSVDLNESIDIMNELAVY